MKIWIAIMATLFMAKNAFCQHQLELETVLPTMKSAHVNQCNPECANEENGGYGFVFGYKSLEKHVNVGIGIIKLVNSYSREAEVRFFQLDKAEFEYKFFRASIAIWLMDIYGYLDEDGKEIVVSPPPWPKFQIGVDVLYFYSRKIWIFDKFVINYNTVIFPAVKIDWISFSVLYRF